MLHRHETEVLIAGAGPVGMLTALLLAERGVDVEVVDDEWRPAARSYALALHPQSLRILDEVGLARTLTAAGHRVDRLAFYEGRQRRGMVRFSELQGGASYLLVLPQAALEEALEEALRRRGVEVRWSQRVAGFEPHDDGVTAQVERLGKESTGYSFATTVWVVDKTVSTRAAFLVGADGHRSQVRQALGLTFAEVARPSVFAVFELDSNYTPEEEMRVVLDDGAASVLWPMRDARIRWSLELGEAPELISRRQKSRLAVEVTGGHYPHLGDDLLRRLVAERAPWFEAELGPAAWSIAVRFEQRLASAFGAGRVWLAGDAGHLAGPEAVHSLNGGLIEAAELAERLHAVLRGERPLGVLEEYGRERHAAWQRQLDPATPAPSGGADEWLQQHARRIRHCLPATGADADQLLAQLGFETVAAATRGGG